MSKKIFLLIFFVCFLTNSKAKQLTNNVIVSIDNSIITDLDINKEINNIEDNVTKIKKDKTKVPKKYHEEIIRVDEYTEPELDSFFSNRYK